MLHVTGCKVYMQGIYCSKALLFYRKSVERRMTKETPKQQEQADIYPYAKCLLISHLINHSATFRVLLN